MIEYAIHEVPSLVGSLQSPIETRDPVVRYLCALFAELAYYYVPQWEIDNQKRAKLIPCDAYQTILSRGRPTDRTSFLQQLDSPFAFAVADRGVVAVGLVINKILLIGFRGTQFLFDWKVNVRSKLAPVTYRFGRSDYFSLVSGRLHSGFAEESVRISLRILDAMRDLDIGEIEYVFITGHSLGGAVAAIAEGYLRRLFSPIYVSVCVFGAPKYADLSAYMSLPKAPPIQVRRPGDIVPTVPPRAFGYVDNPYEFATDGSQYFDPAPYSSSLGGIIRWARFLSGRFAPHKMETYRSEVGIAAGVQGAKLPLASVDKLILANIGASSNVQPQVGI